MADEDNIFLKTLNFFSPANWWEAVVGAATGKSDSLQNNPAPSFNDRLGAVAQDSQLLSGIGTGVDKAVNAPIVGAPLKFVLDFGMRTTDSMFGAFQYADAMDDTSFGTQVEGWRKSWDSFGKPGHLSAGQLIGATINEHLGDPAATGPLEDENPFTADGAANIDALSKRSWYGNVAGGIIDLTAPGLPFAPVAKAAKASRVAGNIDTLAKVEATEEVFNKAAAAGTLDKLSKQPGRSFFRSFADADMSGESYAARLRDLSRQTWEHSTDHTSSLNFLGPRMENATENAKRVMAETAVYARDLGPELGTELIGNTWLSVMGSAKASDRVIEIAPLVMDKIAAATAAPAILSDVSKAQTLLYQAHRAGGDIRAEKILEDTFETPKKKAQAEAIRNDLEKAKLDADQAHDFRRRMMGLKPQFRQKVNGKYVDSFDTARLKESRGKAEVQYQRALEELKAAKGDLRTRVRDKSGIEEMSRSTQKQLTSKETLQDGADALKSKEGRDALAAFGPYDQANYYAREAGAAGQRVTHTKDQIAELEAKVAEAKADRDLLASTPLNDPDAMASWRSDITSARAGVKQATARRDMLAALERVARRELKDDVTAAKAVRPSLNATNLWLKDVLELGKVDDAAVINISPSLLAKAKTAWRDSVGRTYMYQTGDYSPKTFFHVHPRESMASIGTAYGRNSVNVHDRYKGQQELGMYLRKSGVFQGDEIRNAVNELIAAGPNRVAVVVEKYNDLMIERMLTNEGIDMATVKGVLSGVKQSSSSARSYLTGRLKEADETGQTWVKTNEFPGADDASDALHMIDSSFLRSHLADTAPFADPYHVRQFARKVHGDVGLAETIARGGLGAVDVFNHFWKTWNLLRPGLFFRNMLDTGLRATMLMGAADTLMSSSQGSWNLVRNTGLRVGDWSARNNTMRGTALQRIGARQGTGEIIKHTLADKQVEIPTGNGKTAKLSLYELQDGQATAASMAALNSAMNKGVAMHEGLLGAVTPLHNDLIKNVEKWDKYKATDIRWPEAYREHAQALLASPTARKMIEEDTIFDDGVVITSADDRVRRLFSDPEVRDEYNKLSSELNMTREQFIEQLDWEMENMFPEPGMAEAVLSGKLKGKAAKKWVEDHFPVEMRFDVPGFESVLPHATADADRFFTLYKRVVDSAFNTLMDKPDFWLVDHPVAVSAFKKQAKLEATRLLESRRAKYGPDATFTAKDIKTIDARARTHAISTVRKYMYDATYSTEFSQAVQRVSPFFNPWYDSMRAYSKLIYDNPNRAGVMASLWNAPSNLSAHLGEPLVVDVNGEAVARGEEPAQGRGERFIVLSSLLGGKKPFGIDIKLRQSSFNTVLQGDTPWLPGWGPTVTVPLAPTLNSDEDVALWLSDSDNPFVRTLMKSLYPDGEIPRNDMVLKGIMPATWRKIADTIGGGETFWRNVQFGMNNRYLASLKSGEPFDPKRAYEEAQNEAKNAGVISAISQGFFGISAQADVQGQFYANQMHQIQAIPIEQVKAEGFPSHQAMFAAKFPEAANLTWTFTRNETGINATVKAQDRAQALRPLIEQAPELGWFLVGEDNIGGQFSQTAYNQQRSDTYGIEAAGRKRLEPGEVMEQTVAGYGWDQWIKFTAQVEAIAVQYGYAPDAISKVKSMYAQQLGAQNPTWFKDYNSRSDKLSVFFKNADVLAQDGRLADRQDIGMYTEYRAARQQILDSFGLKTLNGTGQNTVLAKMALNAIGSRLATQNLGFQQMWERMLYAEVEPRATDSRFGYGLPG